MKFLADEGIDRQIVEHLREEGYVIKYVVEMEQGISDDAVFELANKEELVLLTADKDFGELVFRLQQISKGVILIRLAGLSPARKAEIVVSIINRHAEELVEAFSVITPAGIRIRHQRF